MIKVGKDKITMDMYMGANFCYELDTRHEGCYRVTSPIKLIPCDLVLTGKEVKTLVNTLFASHKIKVTLEKVGK